MCEAAVKGPLVPVKHSMEGVVNGVQAFIFILPYGPCPHTDLRNLEQAQINLKNMTHFVDILAALINLKGYGYTVCFGWQVKPWHGLSLSEG